MKRRGAYVMMTMRAGSNDFHGSVAEHARNEALDANDWFAARGGQPAPSCATAPSFFVSQESLRLRHPAVEAPRGFPCLQEPPG